MKNDVDQDVEHSITCITIGSYKLESQSTSISVSQILIANYVEMDLECPPKIDDTIFHYESILIHNKRLRAKIEEESKSNKTEKLLSWPYRFLMSTPGNSIVFTVSTLTKDDIMLNVISHLNKCLQAGEVICILYLLTFEAFYVRPCIISSIYIHM